MATVDNSETVKAKEIEELLREDIFIVEATAFASIPTGGIRWKKGDMLRESEIKAIYPDIPINGLLAQGTLRKATLEEIGTKFAVETKITIR